MNELTLRFVFELVEMDIGEMKIQANALLTVGARRLSDESTIFP